MEELGFAKSRDMSFIVSGGKKKADADADADSRRCIKKMRMSSSFSPHLHLDFL